jgi:hypothetical protein
MKMSFRDWFSVTGNGKQIQNSGFRTQREERKILEWLLK